MKFDNLISWILSCFIVIKVDMHFVRTWKKSKHILYWGWVISWKSWIKFKKKLNKNKFKTFKMKNIISFHMHVLSYIIQIQISWAKSNQKTAANFLTQNIWYMLYFENVTIGQLENDYISSRFVFFFWIFVV